MRGEGEEVLGAHHRPALRAASSILIKPSLKRDAALMADAATSDRFLALDKCVSIHDVDSTAPVSTYLVINAVRAAQGVRGLFSNDVFVTF